MTDREEPTWVPEVVVIGAQFDQLLEHGGQQGLRDKGALLAAALARPKNKFIYEDADLASLAAAYAFAIAKTSHPFFDGNKRAGWVVALVFLELNGHEVIVTDNAAIETMLAVADGSMSEDALAEWFRVTISSR